MITFLELGSYGRLGNQLFQYAMLKAVSLETGHELKIPNPRHMYWSGIKTQPCLLNQYNIECDYLEESDLKKIKYNFTEKAHTYFNPQVITVPDATAPARPAPQW